MCTDTAEVEPPSLDRMRKEWRDYARYSIQRSRWIKGKMVRDFVGPSGLTYDVGNRECDRLNEEAWAAEGSTSSTFGRTLHFIKLDNPKPNPRDLLYGLAA